MRPGTIGSIVTATVALTGFLFVAPGALAEGRIRPRAENQQDRIARGVRSGELTARETGRIENREAGLNREVRRMRALDGGTLTPRERALVNRQQNRLSRDIYRQKHDSQNRSR